MQRCGVSPPFVLSVRFEARQALTVDVTVFGWSSSYTLAGEFLQHEKVRLPFGRTADEMGSHRDLFLWQLV